MGLILVRPFSIVLDKARSKFYPVLAMFTSEDSGDDWFLVAADGDNQPCWVAWKTVIAIFPDEEGKPK